MSPSGHRPIAILLAVLVVGSLPVAAVATTPHVAPKQAYDDKVTEPAGNIDGFVGFSTPDWVVTSLDGPQLYVTYAENKFGSLETWVNQTDSRRILDHDAESNRVLLTAPPPDIYGGFIIRDGRIAGRDVPQPAWIRAPLLERSYVERVDVNQQVDLIEPVEPGNESAVYSPPVPDAAVRGGWNTDGVAFGNEVNESTMADVRQTVGADTAGASVNGSGVRVAVLDCGFNTNQGELFGNGTFNSTTRVADGQNFITEQNATANNDFQNVSSNCRHGTWVASSIASNASGTTYDGIAPDASLLFGKVLNDDGSGSIETVREGVAWAEEHDADIIHMSLGSQVYSATLHDEIAEALNGSTSMVVVAAGNSRMNPATRYISSPADTPHPGVIAVAASTTEAPPNASVAYFSEVGPDGALSDQSRGVTAGEAPDIAAPGMEVRAAVFDSSGTRLNETLSGTSMAAPIVSGALALEYDKHPSLVNDSNATRAHLLNTSSAMDHTGTTEVGNGMVNATNLLAHNNTTLTQREARTEAARSRDIANQATSGSQVYRVIGGVGIRVANISLMLPGAHLSASLSGVTPVAG